MVFLCVNSGASRVLRMLLVEGCGAVFGLTDLVRIAYCVCRKAEYAGLMEIIYLIQCLVFYVVFCLTDGNGLLY